MRIIAALALLFICSTMPAQTCPEVISTTIAPYVSNYGCWDGHNFWMGDYHGAKLYRISGSGEVTGTYSGISKIVQAAWDGKYLWLGIGDRFATLHKFNPEKGLIEKTYSMNAKPEGQGGIQGVLWDGKYLWLAAAQNGAGAGSGKVLRFNPETEAVELTITAQKNVNGLACAVLGGREYILSACDSFWCRIDASSGEAFSFRAKPRGYRLAEDNGSVYLACYSTGHNLYKYSIKDGTLEWKWVSGGLLNAVAVAGGYVWTAGDEDTVSVHDRSSGELICSVPKAGRSDLVFDGVCMWSTVPGGRVNKILLPGVNRKQEAASDGLKMAVAGE